MASPDPAVVERQYWLDKLGIADDPNLSLSDLRNRTGGGARVDLAANTDVRTALAAKIDTSVANSAFAPATGSPNYTARVPFPTTKPIPGLSVLTDTATGWAFVASGHDAALSNINDTVETPAIGSNSIKVVCKGDGSGTAYTRKTFGAAVNMTGKGLVFWVKLDTDPADVASIQVVLGDTTFANNYRFRPFNFSGRGGPVQQGAWCPVMVPWSNATIAGAPSRASLAAVSVEVNSKGTAGAPKPVTVHIGGIGAYTESTAYPSGVLSLTFDDSYGAAWSIARPKMTSLGFPGVLYPILGGLDIGANLTTAQVDTLVKVNGWEVGAHATTSANHIDITTMTQADRITELSGQVAWLEANGYPYRSHAYPLGVLDNASAVDVARFFRSSRTTYAIQNPIVPDFPHRLGSAVASNVAGTLLADVKAYVDTIATGGCWGVITFHDLGAASGLNKWTQTDFNALMDYIVTKGCAVRTVAQVLDGAA